MDPAFANALRLMRRKHRSFGLTLQPLTVGHLFLLLELENAYPDHPELAGYPDLMTAVLVCSRKHKTARRMLESPLALWWMKRWGRFARRMDWKREAIAFGEYLSAQLQTPEAESSRGGEMTSPLAWRLQGMLMSEFHLKPEETLDIPVSWAITIWAADADRRGVAKLANERQLDFRSFAREMDKRVANAAQEGNAS